MSRHPIIIAAAAAAALAAAVPTLGHRAIERPTRPNGQATPRKLHALKAGKARP